MSKNSRAQKRLKLPSTTAKTPRRNSTRAGYIPGIDPDKFFSARATRQILGVTGTGLMKLRKRYGIKHIRAHSRLFYYDKADVMRALEERGRF